MNACLTLRLSWGWVIVITVLAASSLRAVCYWYRRQRPDGISFFDHRPFGTDARSLVAWTFYCFGAASQLSVYGMLTRTIPGSFSRVMLDAVALGWLAMAWRALYSPEEIAFWTPLFLWRITEYVASGFYQRVFGAGFPQRIEPNPEPYRMGFRALQIDIVNYIAFAMMFAAIYRAIPDQFAPSRPDSFVHALYFSIITMTTVGFGDITPVTDCARMLVAVEALFGIFMIAVLLGVLLGQRRLYVPIRESDERS